MATPTLKFLLDDGSGSFPFDISRYVLATDGYEITRGRDDWQGAVTAGQLDLTLNNSDGRFTPGSTVIGGGPAWDSGGWDSGGWGAAGTQIVVDQRVRLQETVNGVTFTRFTGYVKSWPVAWPATVSTFATVRLTATDAQARAERRPLRSVVEEEILLDHPDRYYTLGEAEGSTSAGDTSGVGAVALPIGGLGPALTFGTGTGPGVDGLPAPQFFSGQYLSAAGAEFLPAGQPFTLRASAATAMTTGAIVALVDSPSSFGGNNPDRAYLFVDALGKLLAFYNGTFTASAGPVVNDGATHDLAGSWDGTTLTALVDGVPVASAVVAPSTVPYTRFSIGGDPAAGSLSNMTGTISHVALYPTALSTLRLLTQKEASAGFVGEAGTDRLARLAGYAGVPTSALDASLTGVSAAVGWSGSFVGTEIQKTADAELGLTFIDGTGALAFHNRNRVVSKTVPDLILDHQWITPDVQPVVDDQRIVNYMEVTAEGTGGTSLVRDAASDEGHGRYSGSQSYLVQTDAEALDRANWIVANFAEPGATPRYGTLTINLFAMTDAQAATVLTALDLDCWLRVTSMAAQNPGGTTVDVVVQGWNATRTSDTWTIACNVVPHSLYAPVWILGTSQLGVDTRLYV